MNPFHVRGRLVHMQYLAMKANQRSTLEWSAILFIMRVIQLELEIPLAERWL